MPATGTELGVDVDCILDPGYVWLLCSGFRNLGNALARRLSTPRGALFYDPGYGLDLRSYLNAGLTDAKLSELVSAIGSECEKDERVQQADVTATYSYQTSTLRVRIEVLTADGPFRLILGVDQVTVAILNDGLPVVDIAPAVAPAALPQVVQVPGPQGPAGASGATGPAGAGVSSPDKALDEPDEFASSSATEELITQFTFDFSTLPAGNISAIFAASVRVAGGATGTFRLYLGGTDGAINGTLLATISTTAAAFEARTVTNASFANPTGVQLLKITGQTSSAGQDARIKGSTVTLRQA